jgi:hypothetical protein
MNRKEKSTIGKEGEASKAKKIVPHLGNFPPLLGSPSKKTRIANLVESVAWKSA